MVGQLKLSLLKTVGITADIKPERKKMINISLCFSVVTNINSCRVKSVLFNVDSLYTLRHPHHAGVRRWKNALSSIKEVILERVDLTHQLSMLVLLTQK